MDNFNRILFFNVLKSESLNGDTFLEMALEINDLPPLVECLRRWGRPIEADTNISISLSPETMPNSKEETLQPRVVDRMKTIPDIMIGNLPHDQLSQKDEYSAPANNYILVEQRGANLGTLVGKNKEANTLECGIPGIDAGIRAQCNPFNKLIPVTTKRGNIITVQAGYNKNNPASLFTTPEHHQIINDIRREERTLRDEQRNIRGTKAFKKLPKMLPPADIQYVDLNSTYSGNRGHNNQNQNNGDPPERLIFGREDMTFHHRSTHNYTNIDFCSVREHPDRCVILRDLEPWNKDHVWIEVYERQELQDLVPLCKKSTSEIKAVVSKVSREEWTTKKKNYEHLEKVLKTRSLRVFFKSLKEFKVTRFVDGAGNRIWDQDRQGRIVNQIMNRHHYDPMTAAEEQQHTQVDLPNHLMEFKRSALPSYTGRKLASTLSFEKAGGPDGYHTEALGRSLISPQFVEYSRQHMTVASFSARVMPIEKHKPDWTPICEVNGNFRPLMITNNDVKVLHTTFKESLDAHIENSSDAYEYQYGFRGKSSTMPPIFRAKTWLKEQEEFGARIKKEIFKEHQDPLARDHILQVENTASRARLLVLADIKSAFNKIKIIAIREGLEMPDDKGRAYQFIHVLEQLLRLQSSKYQTYVYYPRDGSPQGSTFSPPCFDVGFHRALCGPPRAGMNPNRYAFLRDKIRDGKLLAFADDIALDIRFDELEEMIVAFNTLSEDFGLEFSMSKSMIFMTGSNAWIAGLGHLQEGKSYYDTLGNFLLITMTHGQLQDLGLENLRETPKGKISDLRYLGCPIESSMHDIINSKIRQNVMKIAGAIADPRVQIEAVEKLIQTKCSYFQLCGTTPRETALARKVVHAKHQVTAEALAAVNHAKIVPGARSVQLAVQG